MSHLTNALRAATAAALMGSVACLGTGTANAGPIDTLTSTLSKGYTSSNCSPQQVSDVQGSFNATVVAVLQCGQNPDSSGPIGGKYFLFANSADTASSFTKLISSDTLANCGDAKSPTTWHQGSSTANGGKLACGTYQNGAEIIWTNDAKNVLSYISASNTDVGSLFQWWRANG